MLRYSIPGRYVHTSSHNQDKKFYSFDSVSVNWKASRVSFIYHLSPMIEHFNGLGSTNWRWGMTGVVEVTVVWPKRRLSIMILVSFYRWLISCDGSRPHLLEIWKRNLNPSRIQVILYVVLYCLHSTRTKVQKCLTVEGEGERTLWFKNFRLFRLYTIFLI